MAPLMDARLAAAAIVLLYLIAVGIHYFDAEHKAALRDEEDEE